MREAPPLEALRLDRMTIEEAGPDPVRIARAVHAQLGPSSGPIPIHAVARALDLVEIREAFGVAFAGALIMTPDRDVGAVVLEAGASDRRKRFTLAHELGHFLSLHHVPGDPGRFACTASDVASGWTLARFERDRHRRQEAEANRFAIELLAPPSRCKRALVGVPDLARVVALAEALDLSREATARRYIELHASPTALVFSRDGVVRYVDRRDGFPFVALQSGDRLPIPPVPDETSSQGDARTVSDHEAANPADWISGGPRDLASDLVVQTLRQAGGYAITLLAIEPADDADDED